MKDIPIIFSGPMVRALLDGRKTMTRRLAWKVQPVFSEGGVIPDGGGGQMDYVEPHTVTEGRPSSWQNAKLGDRLWVRENWKPHSIYAGMKPRDVPHSNVFYQADNAYAPSNTPWVPCIHMPRWVSRLTLVLTAAKIEPLLDISEADAAAEGFAAGPIGDAFGPRDIGGGWTVSSPGGYASAAGMFQVTWAKLHPEWDGYSSPEVVALTFTVHTTNIDALPKAAAA